MTQDLIFISPGSSVYSKGTVEWQELVVNSLAYVRRLKSWAMSWIHFEDVNVGTMPIDLFDDLPSRSFLFCAPAFNPFTSHSPSSNPYDPTGNPYDPTGNSFLR